MIISTIKERCKQCYACVRNCPVKAVKIEKGQAEIIEDRCIECGNCLKVCSQQAKKVLDNRFEVKDLLKGSEPVALILAPSFITSFSLPDFPRFIQQLKSLGFLEIWTAAVGAQLIIPEYERLLTRQEMTVSSPCPAVVSLIEKHFPSLLEYLAPIDSPMLATAKYIKSLNPLMKIVFAGPCSAKKGEIQQFKDFIQYALTFIELKSILEDEDNNKSSISFKGADLRFSGPLPFNGQLIPLSGGLTQMLRVKADILETDILVVDGQNDCLQALEAVAQGSLKARFMDILMCRGCIDGPAIDSGDNTFNRKGRVVNYYNSFSVSERLQGRSFLSQITGLDFSRQYANKKKIKSLPREEDILKILASIGKTNENDEINCGACGYQSCREKAIAVYQGIAEVEMCLPYLLEKKSKLIEQLNNDYLTIEELHRELDFIVDVSCDGICLVDAQGIILKANSAFEKLYGLSNLVGTYARELEEKDLAYPSAALLVMKEKRPVTFVQSIHNGRKLLVTGTPIFTEENNLNKILINSRDFTELEELKDIFERNLKDVNKVQRNLGTDNIIAYSSQMGKILETSRKIARVDSTVLIMGESGVGKEVIARYIHSLSERKKGPWVKVNCGAIPETLIESELFGYEAGAFTGAKREGKIGLFEHAHDGTIFLDEIGELPYHLQVKLLQVLQEKSMIRIGGLKPIKVNIRIIAATNRNLEEMVEKGEFRQDLFYRLSVVPITVPPLRNRKDDIVPLAHFFVEQFNQKYNTDKKLTHEVLQLFLGFHWPGNIRELMNVVERLVVTSEQIYIGDDQLPSYLREQNLVHNLAGLPKLQDAVEQLEREILKKAYDLYGNSYTMAEVLGVNQSTVVRKLKKYHIK